MLMLVSLALSFLLSNKGLIVSIISKFHYAIRGVYGKAVRSIQGVQQGTWALGCPRAVCHIEPEWTMFRPSVASCRTRLKTTKRSSRQNTRQVGRASSCTLDITQLQAGESCREVQRDGEEAELQRREDTELMAVWALTRSFLKRRAFSLV